MYKFLFTKNTNDNNNIDNSPNYAINYKKGFSFVSSISPHSIEKKRENKKVIPINPIHINLDSFRNYENKGLISLGDHCAIPEILKQLNIRNCSFPFDWNAAPIFLKNSNINCNMETLELLLKTNGDAKKITELYLGNFFENDRVNTTNNIWFPHEDGTKEEIFAKYERRFTRLYDYLIKNENIFFILNRNIFIPSNKMYQYLDILLSCNTNNKIIFISGKPHDYLTKTSDYNKNILFKHIHYDISKFFDYDYSDFRPNITKFIKELFMI